MTDGAGRPGLYVHVPFCAGGKCPYCDFYSVPLDAARREEYLAAVEREFDRWARRARGLVFDTVYFGGGTPSLLGNGLCRLLEYAAARFAIAPGAEITFEANPAHGPDGPAADFGALRAAGFNRLSLGLQSGVPEELRALGRRHTPQDAADTVRAARAAGFENISLDLMLATPGQTMGSLRRSIQFAAALGPAHISAYLLKVEPGTEFFARRDMLDIPDADSQAEFYELACGELADQGYAQYEISNFARPGRESRHNLKYWNCDDYVGVGPGAHSLWQGRRRYYPRSLSEFFRAGAMEDEGPGGGWEEYAMLRLRLNAGLTRAALRGRFGVELERLHMAEIPALQRAGLVTYDGERLALTPRGFLVSNPLLARLLP